MKRGIVFGLLLLLAGSVAFAAPAPKLALKGWLVDNTCAAQHKVGQDFNEFVEVHDMSCARTCGKDSGFSLYAGGKLYPFAKSETGKIIKYFGADFHNDTRVAVTATKVSGKLKLLTIKANNK
jgi:hypothetical protein